MDSQMSRNDEEKADDPIGRLVRLAGPRTAVAPEREARVKAATRTAWRAALRRRSRRRAAWTIGSLAAAATLLLTLGPGLREILVPRPAPPEIATPEIVATVETVGVAGLTAGAAVHRDAAIVTGDAGGALRLAGGAAVRLDARTRLTLRSASTLELARGAVYVDAAGGAAVEVTTGFGVARDVGTRFEVRVDERSLRLRVREGEVLLERDGETHAASAGDEIVAGAGGVTRRPVSPHGAQWDWVLAAAPPYELGGRTLAEILDWAARESGREVRLGDAAARAAQGEVFVGALASSRPDEVLDGVLATFGLRPRVDGGTLRVESLGF